MQIKTKRVYAEPAASDGHRVLIDRLWPRGLTKEAARVDFWAKSIAPSNELRRWYQHDPAKWDEFRRRYFAELETNPNGARRARGRPPERHPHVGLRIEGGAPQQRDGTSRVSLETKGVDRSAPSRSRSSTVPVEDPRRFSCLAEHPSGRCVPRVAIRKGQPRRRPEWDHGDRAPVCPRH